METYKNAFCARCMKRHDVQAKSYAGAVRRATLICDSGKCIGPVKDISEE